ncbi:DUF3667 domain-containing protein [Pontixanthobacter sp. CEM42]|uniref:DUF3667 domain-containing protein n=1 Tax=Pontixanthobacter sp. CEM42 TaxID=2792077 RepID=UPI001ADF23E7|nr:DUF3667 domain-containing protein [Pontixanthobacter sp. CEM42]
MSGDIGDISGAVGDIGLGAAAAKAVEPSGDGAGTEGSEQAVGNACLNCGTALVGEHCHSCGQKAKIHRTLRAFMHDLVHGVLHFEGKFWRTLPLLAWRPGKLMRDYIDGKRARYVSPIALFLFTVFISFALFSISGGFGKIEPEVDPASIEQLQKNLVEADETIAFKRKQIAEARERGEPVDELELELSADEQGRELLRQLINATAIDDPSIPSAASQSDSDALAENALNSGQTLSSDNVGEWIGDTLSSAASNPGLLVYKLQTNAYKLSWLLIPLSLPFVWILFPFSRRFRMYDHTVFVTYSISFMMMLAVFLSVGIAFQFWPLIAAPLLYAPFHLYRSLKGSYGLSRFGALWRMVILSIGIWASLLLFMIIMMTIVISA